RKAPETRARRCRRAGRRSAAARRTRPQHNPGRIQAVGARSGTPQHGLDLLRATSPTSWGDRGGAASHVGGDDHSPCTPDPEWVFAGGDPYGGGGRHVHHRRGFGGQYLKRSAVSTSSTSQVDAAAASERRTARNAPSTSGPRTSAIREPRSASSCSACVLGRATMFC